VRQVEEGIRSITTGQAAARQACSLTYRDHLTSCHTVDALVIATAIRLGGGMIAQRGGAVAVAKYLFTHLRRTSYGFERLREVGELARSVEFAPNLPWFTPLLPPTSSTKPGPG
jgi:hypothetical protein